QVLEREPRLLRDSLEKVRGLDVERIGYRHGEHAVLDPNGHENVPAGQFTRNQVKCGRIDRVRRWIEAADAQLIAQRFNEVFRPQVTEPAQDLAHALMTGPLIIERFPESALV